MGRYFFTKLIIAPTPHAPLPVILDSREYILEYVIEFCRIILIRVPHVLIFLRSILEISTLKVEYLSLFCGYASSHTFNRVPPSDLCPGNKPFNSCLFGKYGNLFALASLGHYSNFGQINFRISQTNSY